MRRGSTRASKRPGPTGWRLDLRDEANIASLRATGVARTKADAIRIALELAASSPIETLSAAQRMRNREAAA